MSGHDIDSATVTASQAEVARGIRLVAFAFDEGTVRLCSAPFDFVVDADGDGIAETYSGVGELGKISDIQEGSEIQSYPATFTLTGLDPAMIALAVGSHYQGRSAKAWMVFLDSNHDLAAPPFNDFTGRMDTMDVEIGETATVTLTAQSRFADWKNARISRYTNEDQQHRYPGDKGLEFVAGSVSKQINWGGTVI